MARRAQTALCVECSDPVDPDEAHWPHEDDCPNSGHELTRDCTCDLFAHPECCREPGCADGLEPEA